MAQETPRLQITPLGGLGEIGMNCMLWSYDQDMVMVDCGLMFPENYHLGVDVVIPRFDYVRQHRDALRGIVLTHGHEDHIGALPWLIPQLDHPKIYASPFTLALVEHKLRERGLLERVSLIPALPESVATLGAFKFHFFPVCHSIIDGYALGVETPVGRIVHTGDFKADPNPLSGPGTDFGLFSNFAGPEGARLLLSDSTNIEVPGRSLGERRVLDSLRGIFAESEGRIVVTLFSSHIQRIQEVFDCARESGRKVIVSGRSLLNNIEMALRLGYLHAPENLYADSANAQDLPDRQCVLLVTGSQGEPMSALARIVSGGHKHLQIHQGDTIIMSSRMIPGNSTAVTQMVNQMYRLGAEVYHDSARPIHASGHGYQEELLDMIQAVRPEYFIPIHGEYRHLIKHSRLAIDSGIDAEKVLVLENGQSISFAPLEPLPEVLPGMNPLPNTPQALRFEERIPAESILVDGKGVGDVGQIVLRERQILGDEGVVIVVLVLDAATGAVLHGPEILSKGFVFEQQFDHVLEDSKCIVLDVLEEGYKTDAEKIQEKVRSAMRRFFRRVIERDPIVVPVVTVI